MERRQVVAGVLLLCMASTFVAAADRSTLSEHIELTGETEQHEFELNMPSEAESARLLVRARVRSGRIDWKLTDPEGEVRLEGQGIDGNIKLDTGPLENLISGRWSLEVRVERAKGYYRVEWRAES